jgi:hypothetical protein
VESRLHLSLFLFPNLELIIIAHNYSTGLTIQLHFSA